jgi:hypothetical protein
VTDQHAHLFLPGQEDFFGQCCGGHAGRGVGEIAHAHAFPKPVCVLRHGRCGLCFGLTRLPQARGLRDGFTCPLPASAHCIETAQQIFEQRRIARHIGPRARNRNTGTMAGKGSGRGHNIVCTDVDSRRNDVRGKGFDSGTKGVETFYVFRQERIVRQCFGENHAKHSCEQGNVFARLGL